MQAWGLPRSGHDFDKEGKKRPDDLLPHWHCSLIKKKKKKKEKQLKRRTPPFPDSPRRLTLQLFLKTEGKTITSASAEEVGEKAREAETKGAKNKMWRRAPFQRAVSLSIVTPWTIQSVILKVLCVSNPACDTPRRHQLPRWQVTLKKEQSQWPDGTNFIWPFMFPSLPYFTPSFLGRAHIYAVLSACTPSLSTRVHVPLLSVSPLLTPPSVSLRLISSLLCSRQAFLTFCFAVTFHLCAWLILLNKLQSKQICPSLPPPLSLSSPPSSLRRLLWFTEETLQSKYSPGISCINMPDFLSPGWKRNREKKKKKKKQLCAAQGFNT